MKKVGGKLLGFVFGVGILFALLPEKQAGALRIYLLTFNKIV